MTLIDSLLAGDFARAFSWIIAIAIALSVHEFAHAWVATLAGDPTPREQGRVTLNPLAHYDPVGTTCILLFGMGWGKPVLINPLNFRYPRRDDALVSLAGAGANLFTAGVFGLALRFLPIPDVYLELVFIVILLNVVLALFNLLPVYPLDGSHVLVNVLPPRLGARVKQFYAQWGMGLLLGLLLALSFFAPFRMAFWGAIRTLALLFAGVSPF